MKAITKEKPSYTYIRIANGQFVTGSGANKTILGNCLEDFVTEKITTRRDTYDDKDIFEIRLHEADGQTILCLTQINALKALQSVSPGVAITMNTFQDRGSDGRNHSILFFEGGDGVKRDKFELHYGDQGVEWEETILFYAAQIGLMGMLPAGAPAATNPSLPEAKPDYLDENGNELGFEGGGPSGSDLKDDDDEDDFLGGDYWPDKPLERVNEKIDTRQQDDDNDFLA